MNSCSQLSAEALHTATLIIYRKEMNLTSQSITEAFYDTTLFIYIYRREMNLPGQLITEALYTATLLIYIYMYIEGRLIPLVN